MKFKALKPGITLTHRIEVGGVDVETHNAGGDFGIDAMEPVATSDAEDGDGGGPAVSEGIRKQIGQGG